MKCPSLCIGKAAVRNVSHSSGRVLLIVMVAIVELQSVSLYVRTAQHYSMKGPPPNRNLDPIVGRPSLKLSWRDGRRELLRADERLDQIKHFLRAPESG